MIKENNKQMNTVIKKIEVWPLKKKIKHNLEKRITNYEARRMKKYWIRKQMVKWQPV